MGIENMLSGCSPSVIADVVRLVQQSERFRWSLCPLINTQLPGYTGPHTPVFETTCEWMPYNPTLMCFDCPTNWFVNDVPTREREWEDMVLTRPGRFYGDTSLMPGNLVPEAGAPGSRMRSSGGFSSKRFDDASRVMRALREQGGYKEITTEF